MIAETAIGAGAVAAGTFAYAQGWRARHYRDLQDRLKQILGGSQFDSRQIQAQGGAGFSARLTVLHDFLSAESFAAIKAEAERLTGPERSYIPAHKKGGTVAYETLIATAPVIISFYHSPELMQLVSRIVGEPVQPTPIHDQSSLSLLSYTKPGDHIGWHYDHNFYRGRHYTVLLTLANEGHAEGGLSHAVLRARPPTGETAISTAPNMVVVFEGAAVRHKVTPTLEGEKRLVLSMTYCTDPRARWWQGALRRMKDIGFFGIRALWT